MPSTTVLVIMFVIAVLLLVVITFASTVAASDLTKSTYYNGPTGGPLRNAHKYLTIAAVIGWSALAVMVIIFGVAWYAGALTLPVITPAFLNNAAPSEADIVKAHETQQKIEGVTTTGVVLIIVLISLAIVIFVAAVLCVIAAADIAKVSIRDDKANTAYTASIVGAVAGVGVTLSVVVALISYLGIRTYQQQESKKLSTLVEKHTMPAESSVKAASAAVEA